MKVVGLKLRDVNQFKRLDLDFVDPTTNEPLDRVCFIGPNATGKTTLLRLLAQFLVSATNRQPKDALTSKPHALLHVRENATEGYCAGLLPGPRVWIDGALLDKTPWTEWLRGEASEEQPWRFPPSVPPTLLEDEHDLLIQARADESVRLPEDPPSVTLNDAQAFARTMPVIHSIGPQAAKRFWKVLTALIAKRAVAREAFFELPENQIRELGEVKADFERSHPEILPRLSKLWNELLERAGLELDLSGVKLPVQLTDRLEAHVRVKSTGQPVPYNELSTGLRSFLFRLGYLYALYFERQVRHGFVFIDEPENSLHPDFLYGLVDKITNIVHNTQIFVATHSPIVAAQFRAEERFLLDFDDQAFVTVERGHAPQGDDPNDILTKDFYVRSVYGREGLEQWRRFTELHEFIQHESDAGKREAYLREYLRIGQQYNFDPDEVSA